jgi:nucleoside-diphosphate-sugar epimerase
LVLGGPGFVGTAACKELMRRGVETIAASRTPKPYGTFTSHVALDRRDEEAFARVLADVEPDVLLDCACYHPREVAAALRHFRGDRYVFIATGTVLYPTGIDRPAREDDFVPFEGDPPDGDLDYVTGKIWCETLLRRAPDFPSVTLRPPAVLGAGDPTRRIASYFRSVEDGVVMLPAEALDRQLGIVWVRDLGYACALASDPRRPAAGSYNVAWEGVGARRLVEAIAALLGREARIEPVPAAELPGVKGNVFADSASPYGPDPNRAAGLDCTRLRGELGWSASPLEEALAEVAAWYRTL